MVVDDHYISALSHSLSHIRERIRENGIFHGIVLVAPCFWLIGAPSAFFCLAGALCARVFSLLPPSGDRLLGRLAVVVVFSPVFYRRLPCFSRRLPCFYRYIVWFFLAYFGFFS